MRQSPVITLFYRNNPFPVMLDCGANASLMNLTLAQHLKLPVTPSTEKARLADGQTCLNVCGEVNIEIHKGSLSLRFNALIIKNLDVPALAGMPFMKENNIVLDIPNDLLHIGTATFSYNTTNSPALKSGQIRQIEVDDSCVLRSEVSTILLPGESLDLAVPGNLLAVTEVGVTPHLLPAEGEPFWPLPAVHQIRNGHISIPNNTNQPVIFQKHQHVARVCTVTCDAATSTTYQSKPQPTPSTPSGPFSTPITIDPGNQLSVQEKEEFGLAHLEDDYAFSPTLGCYNDTSGRLRAGIKMGLVEPPKAKIRLPNYCESRMDELQQKMDELEDMGVLAKPETVGVVVEHVSPSFLVHRADGDKRCVTSFGQLAAYAKPPPSRSTNIERVFRFIAKHRFIIKTDMKKQFFQMRNSKESMKYLGTLTPYKGIRVYTRAAMGMPGSSEHLDELMARVLGDLMHSGHVTKIADDIYVGADTVSKLLEVWKQLLKAFIANNLRLSPQKTVICPKSTVILGWLWSQGRISPCAHKLNPLAEASPPSTVKGLRQWLGAVKHMKACISKYSAYLSPLEKEVGGKASAAKLEWTEKLLKDFREAQSKLHNAKTITIPKASDQLVITTDGSPLNDGIGAVLYVLRNGKSELGGYFSMKLRTHHQKWLPCEVEALAIASAVTFWSMYITESQNATQILTDSKPCVEAFAKLSRGQFSNSARVGTFLSTLSQYRVTLQHLPGSDNQAADYLSRNPHVCDNDRCQICNFVYQQEETPVCHEITVSDVLDRRTPMPFLTQSAWKAAQRDCPDLRRVYSQKRQGTEASKKDTKCKNVKRYLNVVTINNGLLVVKRNPAFTPNLYLIVVPEHILSGFITALHLRFNHPTKTQLTRIFDRYFYGLNSGDHIKSVTEQCAQCVSLSRLPATRPEFTSTPPPQGPGYNFAADVLRRQRQFILITRDDFSSYTTAVIIPNENKDSLRAGIIETTALLRSASGCKVRVDNATALEALKGDPSLQRHSIQIDVGRVKNPNKNPIAEKAVQELEREVKRSHPDGGLLTTWQLAEVLHTLNSRQRSRGVSAREIIFQRDYISGAKLNLCDKTLAEQLHTSRTNNHDPSARAKVPQSHPNQNFKVGDLVYVKNDGSKHFSRDRFLVTKLENDGNCIYAQKFTNSQFRAKVYELRPNEIYKVPTIVRDPVPLTRHDNDNHTDSDSEDDNYDSASELSVDFDFPRNVENDNLENDVIDDNLENVDVLDDNLDNHEIIETGGPSEDPPNISQPRRSLKLPRHFHGFHMY